MNNFDKISTTHLQNSQKLIDDMADIAARMHGMKEAMTYLLPDEIINSNEFYLLRQALSSYVSGNGTPIAIYLRQWSQSIEKELQRHGTIIS